MTHTLTAVQGNHMKQHIESIFANAKPLIDELNRVAEALTAEIIMTNPLPDAEVRVFCDFVESFLAEVNDYCDELKDWNK